MKRKNINGLVPVDIIHTKATLPVYSIVRKNVMTVIMKEKEGFVFTQTNKSSSSLVFNIVGHYL